MKIRIKNNELYLFIKLIPGIYFYYLFEILKLYGFLLNKYSGMEDTVLCATYSDYINAMINIFRL